MDRSLVDNALVPAAGRCQGVAFIHGKGRVVVLGEAVLSRPSSCEGEHPFGMNAEGNDNRQLSLNVMHWLSGLIPVERRAAARKPDATRRSSSSATSQEPNFEAGKGSGPACALNTPGGETAVASIDTVWRADRHHGSSAGRHVSVDGLFAYSVATSVCGGWRSCRDRLIRRQWTWTRYPVNPQLTPGGRVVDIGSAWFQMSEGTERLATHEQAQQQNNEVAIAHFRLRQL